LIAVYIWYIAEVVSLAWRRVREPRTDNGRPESTIETAVVGTEAESGIWFNEYFNQKRAVAMPALDRLEEP
jgi:hypothetical protein